MKSILNIQAPDGNKHIVWEHLMKSVFAFSGMFALLFFGPMFMEARARRARISDRNGIAYDFLIYILEHPQIQFSICVLAVVAYNLYLIVKNTRKKYVVSLTIIDDSMEIGLTNLYYKGTVKKVIPLSALSFNIVSKKGETSDKKQSVKFYDNTTKRVIGMIQPKHFIWNEQVISVKKAIGELSGLGLRKESA